MGQVIRLRLRGPDADPGRIPAADVARLIQGYERAVARAAEARIRRSARAGRKGAPVESTTRFVFRGIEKGSLVVVLELPQLARDDELAVEDQHLGELAADDVQRTIQAPESAGADLRVLDALDQLGDELGIGQRYDSLQVKWNRRRHRRAQPTAVLDHRARAAVRAQREALSTRAASPSVSHLFGTLIEADFENWTAHLRTSDNLRVAMSFDEERADDIHSWLRRPSMVDAMVEYSPGGSRRAMQVVGISAPVQLDAFRDAAIVWGHSSIEHLIAEQGVGPITDPASLADLDATDDEIDAFLDALRR